jgi:cysteine desulfurase / selenocysteine lyase
MSRDADIDAIRAHFPVVGHWNYLYNGSIHPQPISVVRAMRDFIGAWSEGGEAVFPQGMDAFLELRDRLAGLIGGKGSNIVITESTTSALNLAHQLVRPTAEQNVVLDELAFMTNTYPWLVSGLAGPEVRFVPEVDGSIRSSDMRAALDSRTALLSISAVAVSNGFRHDLGAVSGVAAAAGVPVLADGAQAVGVVDIDLARTPIDFLAGTATKWLMGPAGVGFLHLADQYLDVTPPNVGWLAAANVGDWDLRHGVLHEDAMRFQGGIPNFIGVVGALAALKFRDEIGDQYIKDRIAELTTYLMDELRGLGADLWTPHAAANRAGIVFFRSSRAAEIHDRLRSERIYTGTFMGGIRCDPSVYNTHAELDQFLSVVAPLL